MAALEEKKTRPLARLLGLLHRDGLAAPAAVLLGAVLATLTVLVQGRLPKQGYVRQEEIALGDFLANRFGRAYRQPGDVVAAEAVRIAEVA